MSSAPTLVAPPVKSDFSPMPQQNVLGGGRDRGFDLPQFFFTENGRVTAFADSGTNGPPIVFLHGLAGNATHWVHVAPRFVATHRVICVDLFGHGESERLDSGYSVDRFVDQLVRLFDALDLDPVTVVGHSMGGMVAVALALAAPDRVERAVLVNPAGMQPQRLPFRVGGTLLLRRSILGPLLPRVWQWILRQVFWQQNPWTRRFVRTCDETYDPAEVHCMAHLMESLRPDLLTRDYAAMLPQLALPVWLIWGDRDRLVPAGFLHAASQRLPNVTVEEIEDCGHMPNIERPDRVTRFLARALAS